MSDFGDRVRIKISPDTETAGVAGLEGDVYGFTTPSVTGVNVIGGSPNDHALNVSIEGHGELWFRPDLIEVIHHNAGLEITVGSIKAIRNTDGSWTETESARPSFLNRLKRLFIGQ